MKSNYEKVKEEMDKIILCPTEISVSKKIFFIIFILSSIQFILAFWGVVIINGFIALMLMIASLGFLFMINKIKSIKR